MGIIQSFKLTREDKDFKWRGGSHKVTGPILIVEKRREKKLGEEVESTLPFSPRERKSDIFFFLHALRMDAEEKTNSKAGHGEGASYPTRPIPSYSRVDCQDPSENPPG